MADQITFVVKGKRYPMPSKLTFGDAALLKKMGINLGELQQAVAEGNSALLSDPTVMGGLLVVAMKHAGERVNANTLNDLEISEVDVDVPEDEPEEAADEDPPLAQPSATTPEPSGQPDSSTSLDSILGT